jgi:hypothetical protein
MKVRRLGGTPPPPPPLVPFESDAIAWLDAESLVGVYANGDPVPTWTATINAANGSAAQSGVGAIPTFVANVDASGKPGISFNGSSHYMILGDAWKLPPAGQWTLYVVALRSNSAAGQIYIRWGSATIGSYAIQASTSGRTLWVVGNTSSPFITNPTFNLADRKVLLLVNRDAGTGFDRYINNVSGGSNASNGASVSAVRPLLGAQWGDESEGSVGSFTAMTIQAVLAYSTVHTATERAAVHAFLYDRYGVVP